MSNLKVNSINDASGGNAAVLNGVVNAPQSMGFRNRIINGDMQIDQRNAGASVTPIDGAYTLDRWKYNFSQASKFTAQRSTLAPIGFSNSFLSTVASAVSIGASDYFMFSQRIEGFNFADLGWGSASAQTVTVSFWVRSSLTGTFGGSFTNGAENRSYPFTYAISAANTWEQKTVVVAGDTAGTWVGATNGAGLILWFGLGVGSTLSGTAGAWSGSTFYSATGATSVVGTSGATFYITGVQLEAGTQATSFERVDYGTSLIRCQRYYETSPDGIYGTTGNPSFAVWHYKVTKRAVATISWGTGATTASTNSINFTQVSSTGTPFTGTGTTASAEL